jgi:hypothetical protein
LTSWATIGFSKRTVLRGVRDPFLCISSKITDWHCVIWKLRTVAMFVTINVKKTFHTECRPVSVSERHVTLLWFTRPVKLRGSIWIFHIFLLLICIAKKTVVTKLAYVLTSISYSTSGSYLSTLLVALLDEPPSRLCGLTNQKPNLLRRGNSKLTNEIWAHSGAPIRLPQAATERLCCLEIPGLSRVS